MSDLKKIMVALAFSDYSQEVFDFAARMAGRLDADMVVVSVINERDVETVGRITTMGYNVNGEHYVEALRKDRREALEAYRRKAAYPDERVKLVVRVGNPVEKLLQTALEDKVDLIVMGIKGRSELEHLFVGSVADKMFQRSPVPIVSYRDQKTAARMKKRIRPEA
jgi:nucleotide-binding universal stress UspA family protein